MSKTVQMLAFSDLHAHNYSRYARLSKEGLNSRLQTTVDVLVQIREYALRHNIPNVLFGGDMFEAKHKTPVTAINAVYRELLQWEKAGVKLLAIPGNHDYAVRSGLYHAMEPLGSLPNVTLVSEPSTLTYRLECGTEIDVVAVPYQERPTEDLFDSSGRPPGHRPLLCLAHGTPQGSMLGPKRPFQPAEEDHEGVSPGIIQKAWLQDFDLAVMGHIHYPHKLHKKVLITGQPFQLHGHEWNQERGFWKIDLFEEGGGWKQTTELIPTNTPRFLYWSLTNEGECEVNVNKLSHNQGVKGNINIVEPMDPSVGPSVINESVASLYQQGAFYVDVAPPKVKEENESKPRVEIDPHSDPTRVLRQVLESELVDLEGFDPLEVLREGALFLQPTEESQ